MQCFHGNVDNEGPFSETSLNTAPQSSAKHATNSAHLMEPGKWVPSSHLGLVGFAANIIKTRTDTCTALSLFKQVNASKQTCKRVTNDFTLDFSIAIFAATSRMRTEVELAAQPRFRWKEATGNW